MNGKKPSTKNTLPSKALIQICWRNQKLYRQVTGKRFQHHQTSFTAVNGTSLGEKEKGKTYNNKPKTMNKMVMGTYI